jgi:predicted RecA/RadA family phage recombinase
MAKNQALPGPQTGRRFALCPTTVKSGDFVLLGDIAAVALDDYKATELGTTFDCMGSHILTVIGKSSLSPSVGLAAGPGAKLYLDGGVLDAPTNVTTGGTIDTNNTGVFIGWLDPQYQKSVATNATDANAWVKLKGID